jgi:hypothetical protein
MLQLFCEKLHKPFHQVLNSSKNENPSHARIDARDQRPSRLREPIPCLAHWRNRTACSTTKALGDRGRSLEHVDCKTQATMPREVTVWKRSVSTWSELEGNLTGLLT